MADIPLLSGVGDKLKDWEEQVIEDKIMGHALRMAQEASTGGGKVAPMGMDPVSAIARALGPKGGSAASAKGLTGRAWVDEAYKDQPWERMGTSLLLDPTNLIGFGLPGLAAKGAIKVPMIGSQLAKGLQAANVVDALPGKITGKAIDTASDIGRAGLKKGFDTVAPHIPDNPTTQAIGKAYDKTMQGWREQALLAPAYHVANYVGNMEAALRSGQGDVIKATAMGPLRGRSKEVDQILRNLSNDRAPLTYASGAPPPPIDPTAFGPRHSDQMAKLGREPNVNNPLSTPSVFRDIPDTVAPLNWARDKFAGLSETSKKFGQGRVEGPGVDAAFQKTFQPEFKKNANEFYQELQRVVDPKTGKRPPEVANAIAAFKKSKGQMSPDDLKEILKPGAGARRAAFAANPNPPKARKPRTPDYLDDVVTNWENRIIGSMEAGTKNSTDIFFDYTADNPIDKIGQNVMAFHRFPINSLPKSLKQAGKTPLYANVPREYYRASDEYNEEKGLPASFHGQMPFGPKLPGGTQVMADPLGMTAFGALMKSATRPSTPYDNKGTGIGEVADDMRGLGLGLNPLIDTLLTVTGQHGRSFAPSFLRASQPINGVASQLLDRPVDIEGFPKELLGNAQEHFTGQRPFPYQEYLLRKRRAELKASGKDTSLAGSQLGDTMETEGLGRFMGIPGLKLLSPEEQTIRKAQQLARAMDQAGVKDAYTQQFPMARAYTDLDPRDETVRNWDSQSADVRQRLLRDPEVRADLSKEWNWKKLSASERAQLLRDPELRDGLLDMLALQLHNTNGKQPARSVNPLMAMNRSYVPGTSTKKVSMASAVDPYARK